MGVVYLARNKLMDRLEVLKVISTAMMRKVGALGPVPARNPRRRFPQPRQRRQGVQRDQLGELLVFAMEYVEAEDPAN